MKKYASVLVLTLLTACAATGPSYESRQQELNSDPGEDSSRLVFYRTKEERLYIGRKAPVKIDGEKAGACSFGGFFYREVEPGTHALRTDIWDMPGKCIIDVNVESGKTHYFYVGPREESFLPGLLGGVIGNAIESSGKECGGAFKIYPVPEEVAKKEMVGLKLSD